jgi:RNA polymerase sigma-B factor
VQLYLPLVEAFARRYGMRGAEYEDLVQVGSIGLLNAIERFDPKRGDEFTAFAVPTIAGEIKRHLRDRSKGVSLPRRLKEASMRLPGARERLTARLGRSPEPRELATELGVAEEDLPVLEESVRLPQEAEEAALGGDVDDRLQLAGAFKTLDDTERKILYLRFVRELSRRETAAELGMTEDQLRRRTRIALATLRTELEAGAFPAPAQLDEVTEPQAEPPLEQPAPAEAVPPAGSEDSTPAAKEGRHSGRILVRMPPPLHDELADAAARQGVSLNQFITKALGVAVHPKRPGEPGAPAPRWLPAAIVTNIVVVTVAGIAAVALLLVAWQQGW